MRTPSIIVCGNLTLDELVKTRGVTLSPGGSALFVSGAATYLGVRTGILGNLGADYPESSLRWLESRGVDLRLLSRTRRPSTRFRIIRHDGNRRLSLIDPGRPVRAPRIKGRLQSVHLGPVFNEISIALAGTLRNRCGFLSLDLQGFVRKATPSGRVHVERRNLGRLLKLCDLVQASIEEATPQVSTRTQSAVLRWFLDFGPKYCILTLGEGGSMLGVRPNEKFLVPAFPDRSISDTTGAGDVFAGSWLATYLSTKDPVWAAAVGSAFASLSSRKTGLSKFRFSRRELFRRASLVYGKIKSMPGRQ